MGKMSTSWLSLFLSQSTSTRRRLYDQAYIDAGCPPGEYDESTEVDNLFWTYITNYLIAAIAVITSLVLYILLRRLRRFRDQVRDPEGKEQIPSIQGSDENINVAVGLPRNLSITYYIALVVYFIVAGLAYGIAGIGHQVVTEKDSSAQSGFGRATALFTGIAAWTWIAVAALEYHHAIKHHDDVQPGSGNCCCVVVSIIVATIWVIILVVLGQLILMGITVLVSIVAALTMAVWQYKKYGNFLFLSDMVSVLVYLAGIAVQAILGGVCGDDGYDDCFKDCPLPNPSEFNHNAIFHILAGAYFMLYGLTKVIMMQKIISFLEAEISNKSHYVPTPSPIPVDPIPVLY